MAVNPRAAHPPGAVDQPVMIFEDTSREVPCGDQVEPVWYALDVFVPLLDLKQEVRCDISVREDAWGWRAFKSIYAILGALVSSLVLLTVSGVLRRRAEE